MRIAIISDVHGNLTALDAVIADLRETALDIVLHGGDLAAPGSSPVAVIDRIRDLGWAGVLGNTDEMLFDPASLETFFGNPPRMPELVGAIRETAAWTCERLGGERIAWLRTLPSEWAGNSVALVHATANTTWRAPSLAAADDELESAYSGLTRPLVVYGHIHTPFIRKTASLTIANAGSVGAPYDGDPRASYLLIDDGEPGIRRVNYDVEREIKALRGSGIPRAEWIAAMLRAAAPKPLQ